MEVRYCENVLSSSETANNPEAHCTLLMGLHWGWGGGRLGHAVVCWEHAAPGPEGLGCRGELWGTALARQQLLWDHEKCLVYRLL